ncbi:MAG TPA: M20/M25/M40 family metallo-hydrolase, partial [Armatimonadota bacterium]
NVPHGDIQVIFSIGEESGLYGAKYLDINDIASKCVYVFDAGSPVGSLTTSAPYHDNFNVKFHGKAAHSGSDPEKGINAVLAACKAVANMKLGRIDPETTANVGVINGGVAKNIVPEFCMVEAEARSREEGKLAAQTEHMVEVFHEAAADVGAGVDIEVIRSYSGYNIPPDAQIVKMASEAARRVGIKAELHAGGGGSDANILNSKGIPALPVGVGYNDPHSVEENLPIADFVKCTEMTVELIKVAAGN